MAKRPQPKPKGQASPTSRATVPLAQNGPAPGAAQVVVSPVSPRAGAARDTPQRSSTYFEAMALYERAVETLQRHDYSRALELLQSILRKYPEERELQERVRLYLNVCER